MGDMDPREVEKKVKEVFSSLKHSPSPIKLSPYPLEYSSGVKLSEVRDSVRTSSRMECIIPHPCVVERTLGDAVLRQKGRLLVRAINTRLQARNLSCDVSDHWYLSDKNHFVLAVEGGDKQELLSRMTRIVTELNCLERDGWDPNEWQDIRSDFCRRYEKSGTSPSFRTSSAWCDDFVDYVISGDRYLTDDVQRGQVKKALEEVSVEEMQRLLEEWLSYRKETLLVACVGHAGFGKSLTTEEVEDVWERGLSAPCESYDYATPRQQEETTCSAPGCLSVSPPLIRHTSRTRRSIAGQVSMR